MTVLTLDAMDRGRSYIEQYGIKGMKWGVRKQDDGRIAPRATRNKADRRVDTSDMDEQISRNHPNRDTNRKMLNHYNKTFRDAAPFIRSDIRRINKDPQYASHDFTKDSPIRKKYYDTISRAVERNLNEASGKVSTNARPGNTVNPYTSLASQLYNHNKSTKAYMSFRMDVTKSTAPIAYIRIDKRVAPGDYQPAASGKLYHEDSNEIPVEVEVDSLGKVINIIFPEILDSEISMAQEQLRDDAFLEHYGIKGMRWGVIRDFRERSAEGAAAKSGRKEKIRERKKAVKERRNLSDAELEKRVRRAQLEKQLREATDQDLAPKRTAIKKALGGAAKTVAATALPALATYAGRKIIKKYMKNEALANEVFPPKTKKNKGTQDAGKAAVETIIRTNGLVKLPTFVQSANPKS